MLTLGRKHRLEHSLHRFRPRKNSSIHSPENGELCAARAFMLARGGGKGAPIDQLET